MNGTKETTTTIRMISAMASELADVARAPCYLVVANETMGSFELIERLGEIGRWDPQARFTLVVPTTPVNRTFTWSEGESAAAAEKKALQARGMFEGLGLRVVRAVTGDASPVQAIADELASGGRYDAIVISTYPAGISRWLRLDVHARARQRFDLPIIPVVASRARQAAA